MPCVPSAKGNITVFLTEMSCICTQKMTAQAEQWEQGDKVCRDSHKQQMDDNTGTFHVEHQKI
jgi:hypothetical protein